MSAISFTERRPQSDQMSQELLALIADHRRTLTGTSLASAARTTVTQSADIINHDCAGVAAFLNITVASGTGGLSHYFGTYDPVSGTGKLLNSAPTAIVATGIYWYCLHPSLTAAFNTSANQLSGGLLPRTFYSYVNVGDASSYTYSVGFVLIP